jgi:hypothetical protein
LVDPEIATAPVAGFTDNNDITGDTVPEKCNKVVVFTNTMTSVDAGGG